jgi:hypothetical protein
MEKLKTDTENMLKKARIKSNIGTKLTILLSQRNLLQLRLDELNKTRYYCEAEIKLHYLNEHQRLSNDLSTYKMRNILYSTDLQTLGKDIVGKLNEIETKLISDLISMTKTHLELRIELIDKLIKDINDEKSYTHTG